MASAKSLSPLAPRVPLEHYARNESRFRMIEQQNPEHYREMLAHAKARTAAMGTAAGNGLAWRPTREVISTHRGSSSAHAGPGLRITSERVSMPIESFGLSPALALRLVSAERLSPVT
jgi:hypothetical protein